MNTNITKYPLCSLYELAIDKIIANLKSDNLNIKGLEQLNIPKVLINDTFAAKFDEEYMFRDIKSRATRINTNKATGFSVVNNDIRKEGSKPGPAFLPTTSSEDDETTIVDFQIQFYYFICSDNFCHSNRYFIKQISIKLINLYNTINKDILIGVLNIIDTIDVLKLYENNNLNMMKKIIEIIKLIETQEITNDLNLSHFSNELYNNVQSAIEINLDLYKFFLVHYSNFLKML